MSFLNRFRRPRADNRSHPTGSTDIAETKQNTPHQKTKARRPLFDMNSGNLNRRPSFGQWIKMTWLDILTMAVMGAVGLGVYNADPAPSRSFPITFASTGEIVYPQFAYPLRAEIVPIWEAALLASLVPIAVFLLMQIRIRSFWDLNNAIIGLLYSLITAAVFQVFIKWLIGGLRPHFLYVCAPDLTRVTFEGGQGFQNIMFQRDICTGDRKQINDSLESMPSGHSTAAWAGFLYLYYYLNAKLKVWSNYHPAMWKLLVTYAPVLGAFLITGALTIDEFHNWYDCLVGAIIGSVMATSAYRMVYASVWDFRFNHIPLTRHVPFSFGAGEAGAGGFETAVFTHKAGWSFEEAYGGAPFDAAHHLRGARAGFNTAIQDHGERHGNGHDLESGRGLGHGHGTGTNMPPAAATTSSHGGIGTTPDRTGRRDVGPGHDDGYTGTGTYHDRFGRDGTSTVVGDTHSGARTHHDRTTRRDTPGYIDQYGSTGTHHDRLGRRSGDGTGYGDGYGGSGPRAAPPIPGDSSNNRYRLHSRSLERKAINRNSGGAGLTDGGRTYQ